MSKNPLGTSLTWFVVPCTFFDQSGILSSSVFSPSSSLRTFFLCQSLMCALEHPSNVLALAQVALKTAFPQHNVDVTPMDFPRHENNP